MKRPKIPFYGLPRPKIPIQNGNVLNNRNSIDKMNVLERCWLVLENALLAYHNPKRADSVAAVGELTGSVALQQLYQCMKHDTVGYTILQEKPIISKQTIPYEPLMTSANGMAFEEIIHMGHVQHYNEQQQEQNDNQINYDYKDLTFGQAYGSFLATYHFDPDERDEIKYIDSDTNADLAYIMLRYRQCHDFYHTLTGLPPTVLGEIGLKLLELYQTGLPIAVLSSMIGSLRLPLQEQHIVWNVYLPWAIRVSRGMPYGTLLNVYYEKEFDTPLYQLRHTLNIIPAPPSIVLSQS